MSKSTECKDHLGNVYSSVVDMCKFYNIPRKTYLDRINRRKMSIEEALTTPVRKQSVSRKHKVISPFGDEFNSITEMCAYYDIDDNLYRTRIKAGLSPEEALLKPIDNSCKSKNIEYEGCIYTQKEFCNFLGISACTFRQLSNENYTIDEIVLYSKTRRRKHQKHVITDYLGNTYDSIKDMCNAHNISASTYIKRIQAGWSMRRALSTPVKIKACEVFDHLGNKYNSIKDMCNAYGITRRYYDYHIKKNALLSDILAHNVPVDKVYDHTGQEFDSVISMCSSYGINHWTYRERIRRGLSVEEALTLPYMTKSKRTYDNLTDDIKFICEKYNVSENTIIKKLSTGMSMDEIMIYYAPKIQDHLGNKYSTIKDMCDTWHVTVSAFYNRRSRGASIEEALTRKVQTKTLTHYDHLGNKYNTLRDMCDAYDITTGVWDGRKSQGWSIKDILTTPMHDTTVYDHLGNSFKTLCEMLDHYGITRAAYYTRLKVNWDLERILTTPLNPHYSEAIDHYGNIFPTITDMVKYHNCSISANGYRARIELGWTVEEALTIPRNMYIGEYRVAECLKRLNVKFYHDCTIKTIFKDFNIEFNWDDFLNTLQNKLSLAGINWSKSKIEKLRPDFILYTDDDNKIKGIIEFDGEQHQNFVEFFFKTIEEFYRRSDADFVKQSLWEYLNIPMLRIRHDQVDMIDDMVNDFIDNPQNYIHNHNTYLSEDEYWSILSEEKAKLELAFAS